MIELDRVSKVFGAPPGAVRAVDQVCFRVEDGETVCLIGTSGSGKTTTLKMVNRLEEPTSGRILVDGQDVQTLDLIRLRRSLGYVIQKGGLFPHRTVAQNIGLLPRLEGWPAARIRARVEELLELVSLPPERFAKRHPHELSGGQQQRVGVARALALDPSHILMDEPFGALDPLTRDSLQEEFLCLKSRVGKTILLVTHDLAEAFRLGDRVALMHEGSLVQIGTRVDFRLRPASPFVEEFLRSHLDGPGEALALDLLDPEARIVRAGEEPGTSGPRLFLDANGLLEAVAAQADGPRFEKPPTLEASAKRAAALELLLKTRLPALGVLDEQGRLLGAVTPKSALRGLQRT